VARILEAPHPPFPLPRGLVRVLGPVVQSPMLPVLDARQHLSQRRPVAGEFVRNQHARHKRKPLEQLPQEFHGCPRIAPPLDQDVEDVAVLVDGPPEGVLDAVDRDEDLVQVPLIARTRATSAQRVGIRLAEFLAPLPDRLVGDDHAPLSQQFFDVAVAEGEAEVQPDRVADDCGREAMALVAGRGRTFIRDLSIACLGS